jgi:hypothetical protein
MPISSTVWLDTLSIVPADDPPGWPSGMLVDAYKTCGNATNPVTNDPLLYGAVDGCSVFEASRNKTLADNCFAAGQVVAEVSSAILKPVINSAKMRSQPIGYDTPLLQLPGNNPEFNSSKLSADYPKVPRAGYLETAQAVTVEGTNGICANIGNRQCHDYIGGAPAASGSISMLPAGFQQSTSTTPSASISTQATTLQSTSTQLAMTSATTAPGGDVLLGNGSSMTTVTVTVTASNTACLAENSNANTARNARRSSRWALRS